MVDAAGEGTLVVRRAAVADVDALAPMMAELNRLEAIPWTIETGRPVLERLLADPALGMVLLGRRDAAAAGYAVITWGFDLEFGGRDAFLTELYLEPTARGRGDGRALLAAACDAARDEGARAIHLMVRFDNAAAIGLYRSAGFESPPRHLFSKRLDS